MGTREEIQHNFLDKTLEEGVRRLHEVCEPYGIEAFQFVLGALEYTQHRLPARRHVTGKELLDGIIAYGREQFGPMLLDVWEHWGIHSTEDFGVIVFKMVQEGILSKTDQDTMDDFKGVYDLKKVSDST